MTSPHEQYYDEDRRRWPEFTPIHQNDSGLEAANEDESVEETYFRLILESVTFDRMNSQDKEMFLLEIAAQCIHWVQNRHDY